MGGGYGKGGGGGGRRVYGRGEGGKEGMGRGEEGMGGGIPPPPLYEIPMVGLYSPRPDMRWDGQSQS